MGGCCGGMKTGQKSLPDKKKSSSDVAALEKSNGKEAIPATDAGKTPTPDGQQQKESIAASAQEPVKGGGGAEPAVGSDNVMDLDTAVAPFEGVVSSADQPQIQANVAAADSDLLLLPYQIPAQHTTLSCTTTTTTITTVRQEGVLLRVDEPLVEADFQGGSDLASPSSTGDVQVETVTKVTETVTTEAIPAVPEFGSTGESGEAVVEPAVVVVKSSSHEVQRLPDEILPSGELEGCGLTGEAGVGAEVSLPGFSVGFDHQLSPDPSQTVVSESVSGGEQVVPLHAEFAIGEPSGFVRNLEQELIETVEIQQQVVSDLEAAPESATESSSVPVQDIEVNASLESPAQSAGEPLSTSSPFEAESSAPELHGRLDPEFSTTSPQQPEDFPPPLQRDQAAEAQGFEGVADLSVTPSLPEELVKESEAGVAGSLQWEQDQAAEPAPYLQTEESQSRHQEFEQEQEPYQEQQQHSEEPASYHAASGVESFEVQDPVSVSDDVIQSVETRPVIESVSEEVNESRNTWWKEGGQQEPEGGEVPVVETVSDQAQQSRQSWWEQSGSEPVPQREELPAESLPPQPDDLSSIPPPPPSEEEQAVITTPSIPAEIDAVSPSSDSFPEVIPEPLPSTFDQGGGAAVESPLSSSVDGSTLPTENGEVSGSSDEAFTPASVLSPEGSTPGASNLSPDGVEPAAAASSKEPIPTQA